MCRQTVPADIVRAWAPVATTLFASDSLFPRDEDLRCLCTALERHHRALAALVAASRAWHPAVHTELAAGHCVVVRDLFQAAMLLLGDLGKCELSRMYFSMPRATSKARNRKQMANKFCLHLIWDYDSNRIPERVRMVWNFMDWITTHTSADREQAGKACSVWDGVFTKKNAEESADVRLAVTIGMQAVDLDTRSLVTIYEEDNA